MANRATPDMVKAVILSGVDVTHDLTPFITAAHSIIEDECLASGYDEDKLTLIETWLSAHFYACDQRRTIASSVGQGAASESFDKIEVNIGLTNTIYGQMAIRIDTAGNLAAMDNAMNTIKKVLPEGSAGSTWLGKSPPYPGCGSCWP